MKTTRYTVTETQAYNCLRIAQLNEHLGLMASSAKSTAEDAASLFNKGDFYYCAARALDSLGYSVGVFSEHYLKVQQILGR